jgi:hypothetical protein
MAAIEKVFGSRPEMDLALARLGWLPWGQMPATSFQVAFMPSSLICGFYRGSSSGSDIILNAILFYFCFNILER